MSPSIKFKDVDDEQDIEVALRLDYKQFPHSEVQSTHQRIMN